MQHIPAEPDENADDDTTEVAELVEIGGDLYVLTLVGEDGDAGNAVGNVSVVPADPDDDTEPVLWTNDLLRVLTRSPKGALWAASSNGTVYTTAKLKWPPPADATIEFGQRDGPPRWRATSLPDLRKKGYAPSITALLAVTDKDVHAGSFTGSLYHWDGLAWSEVWDASAHAIYRIVALGEGRAMAVGAASTLLHFDGSAWSRLRDPDGAKAKADISGAVPLADGGMLLCDQSGRLLHGGADGFTVLSRHDLAFYAAAEWSGRIFLAAGPDGVAELVDGVVQSVKPNVQAVGISVGEAKVYFVEAAPDAPSYVEYDPRDKKTPWSRVPF